jgi:hypothetical protein
LVVSGLFDSSKGINREQYQGKTKKNGQEDRERKKKRGELAKTKARTGRSSGGRQHTEK